MRALAIAALLLGLLSGACGDDAKDTAATTTTAPSAIDFPPANTDIKHGGNTWGVVLAAGESTDDPAIQAAIQLAEDNGFIAGPTDCDSGASEALGYSQRSLGVFTVSVYFKSQEDAKTASKAFKQRGATTAVVALLQTFCLD